MRAVAFDIETRRFTHGYLAPKPVCATWAWRDEAGDMHADIASDHPDERLEERIEEMLDDEDVLIVTHGGAYDWTVVLANFPRLVPKVFAALLAGRCTDTRLREKLLNLSDSGKLENVPLPDGSSKPVSYHLTDLEKKYLGVDRSDQKEGDDVWRVNYQALEGWPSDEYPEDARQYALDDTSYTLQVYEAQEQAKHDRPWLSTQTDAFQLTSDVCLRMKTCVGTRIDNEAAKLLAEEVHRIHESTEPELVEAGVLRAAVPARPHTRQQAKARELIEEELGSIKAEWGDWSDWQEWLEERGIKFTKPKKASVNEKALHAHVLALYKRLGQIPELTDASTDEKPRPKLDAETRAKLVPHDRIVELYDMRKEIAKIADNQLPVLLNADFIHANYDVLKETGRTSSYDGGKRKVEGEGEVREYWSYNDQQVPNLIKDMDPRRCHVPREGRVFWDVDYTALELACVGQVTYDLFGESVHRDKYNAGFDLHSFLGSGLALMMGTEGVAAEFAQACRAEGVVGDRDAVYHAFLECKKHEEEGVRNFFKHWRKFAKPVGLGFPGGLGAATMVTFARQTYGVIMTEDDAREFKEAWLEVYPEMRRYFQWVNQQFDEVNAGDADGDTLYQYTTPMGMIRRGASFCAVANGMAMQSPGAEGAKIADILVTRECFDPTQESVLYGCLPLKFVHDQIIGETTTDESLWEAQCMRVKELMLEGLRKVLPDIEPRSDEAHLTTVWTKSSEPVFDDAGHLIPWTPGD